MATNAHYVSPSSRQHVPPAATMVPPHPEGIYDINDHSDTENMQLGPGVNPYQLQADRENAKRDAADATFRSRSSDHRRPAEVGQNVSTSQKQKQMKGTKRIVSFASAKGLGSLNEGQRRERRRRLKQIHAIERRWGPRKDWPLFDFFPLKTAHSLKNIEEWKFLDVVKDLAESGVTRDSVKELVGGVIRERVEGLKKASSRSHRMRREDLVAAFQRLSANHHVRIEPADMSYNRSERSPTLAELTRHQQSPHSVVAAPEDNQSGPSTTDPEVTMQTELSFPVTPPIDHDDEIIDITEEDADQIKDEFNDERKKKRCLELMEGLRAQQVIRQQMQRELNDLIESYS